MRTDPLDLNTDGFDRLFHNEAFDTLNRTYLFYSWSTSPISPIGSGPLALKLTPEVLAEFRAPTDVITFSKCMLLGPDITNKTMITSHARLPLIYPAMIL